MIGSHNMSYAHNKEDIHTLLATYDEVFPLLKRAVDGERLENHLKCEPLRPLFKVR